MTTDEIRERLIESAEQAYIEEATEQAANVALLIENIMSHAEARDAFCGALASHVTGCRGTSDIKEMLSEAAREEWLASLAAAK